MLGIPLGSLGIGITIWEPPQDGGGEPEPEGNSLLQEDGLTNFVLQEEDGSNITLEG